MQPGGRVGAVVAVAVALAGCEPLPQRRPPVAVPSREGPPARLVAAERASSGTRLVFVAEDGRRLADLTPLADDDTYRVDRQPAWSPDGRWIAFASTRARALPERTSLWIVEARAGAVPVRLTDVEASDRDPAWEPDGAGIVFASDRAGSFDLWRLSLNRGGSGAPIASAAERLTELAGDAVAPAVAADGTLAFAVIDRQRRVSELWRARADGGGARALTAGPLDRDPAWSPDGQWIAFAGLAGEGRGDLDLHVVKRDGTRRARLVDDPIADERSPIWSPGGHALLAIAELRSAGSGLPFFAAIVVVPMSREDPSAMRVVADPVVLPRLDVAVAPGALDVDALAKNPVFDRAAVLNALANLCLDHDPDARPEACTRLAPD